MPVGTMFRMKQLPNFLSVCRILFSLGLLAAANWPVGFASIYLLCGISDVLDGYLARKWHAESRLGSILDSLGDFIFWAVVFYMFIHTGITVQSYLLWILAAVILLRGINFVITRYKFCRWGLLHTCGNKAAGLLLYLLLPVCYVLKEIPVEIGLILGIAALLSSAEECAILLAAKEYDENRKGLLFD